MTRSRSLRAAAPLSLLAVALVLRLPLATSRSVLTYDDGVYLASVQAMRRGGLPFRDVYSSQGPAFLPLLWLGDLLGLRTPWAARLTPLIAGLALVLIVHRLAARVGDGPTAFVAAALVATSGTLLFATSRIESDGVAAALAAAAVLAATGSGRRAAVAAVVLIGLALAVKSLLVVPGLLAVLWLLDRRHGAPAVAAALGGAGFVVLVLSLPFGVADVWEQAVLLHLDARSPGVDLAERTGDLGDALLRRDRILLAAGALSVAAVARRRRSPPGDRPEGERDVTAALWIWLVTALLVLLLHSPVFAQHLTAVVAPAALLVARYRPPSAVLAAAAIVLLPGHGDGAEWRLSRPRPTPSEQAMIEQLAAIEPAGALVITDEQALGWLAGRSTPGSLVDTSFVRIDSGDLTTEEVVAAAHEPNVCAVLFWSGRLDGLPHLRSLLTEYRTIATHGDRELALREGCSTTPR